MKKKIAVVAVALCLVIALVALCACTPKLDKLKEKYKAEGYAVTDLSADGFDIKDAKIEYAFTAIKGGEGLNIISGGQMISVVCFGSSEDAKTYYEKAKEAAKESSVKVTVKKKGNAIASGTEEAMKLF